MVGTRVAEVELVTQNVVLSWTSAAKETEEDESNILKVFCWTVCVFIHLIFFFFFFFLLVCIAKFRPVECLCPFLAV